tara:strand:+ start:1856 stop:2341 length:486 start_codon:yes stop_codon:yes gene_type:complete
MNLKKLQNQKISGLLNRIGLGLFFLTFGILKFVASDWFIAGPYKGFYGIQFQSFLLILVGLIQMAIAVSFFLNYFTKISAGIGSIMILSTIIATFPKIMTTFVLPPPEAPPGFLFFASIPLLFMALSEFFREGKQKALFEKESEYKKINSNNHSLASFLMY